MPSSSDPEIARATDKNESKDFVEHLRTVHFTLLVICLASVVIVLSPPSSDINRANEQLTQIIAIKNAWKADWLGVEAERMVKAPTSNCRTDMPYFGVTAGGKTIVVHGVRLWTIAFPFPREQNTNSEKDLNLKQVGLAIGHDRNFIPQLPAPTTLEDFHSYWNASGFLSCPKEFLVPKTGDVWTWNWAHSSLEQKIGEISSTQELQQHDGSVDFVLVSTGVLEPGFYNDYKPEGALLEASPEKAPFKDLVFAILTKSELLTVPLSLPDAIKEDFPQYRVSTASFESAFPDLTKATLNRRNLSLEHLKELLHSEETASKEIFEAFGIKFPLETAVRWAVFLILAVQIYFWIHLTEFRRRQVSDNSIAWIGLYPSYVAKMVFHTTAFIIPPLVVCLLCRSEGLGSSDPADWVLTIVVISISVYLSAVTIRTFRNESKSDQELSTFTISKKQIEALQQMAGSAVSSSASQDSGEGFPVA